MIDVPERSPRRALARSRLTRWLPRSGDDQADPRVSVVVHTDGTGALAGLLESLAQSCRRRPPELVVVDARADRVRPLPTVTGLPSRVLETGPLPGPAARNAGLRAAAGEWVVMLDDDVIVERSWYDLLLLDLRRAGPRAAGVVARVEDLVTGHVVLGGDVAYRRLVALSLGGFPERFPREACHPDVELAQRMARSGWSVVPGIRTLVRRPTEGHADQPSALRASC